MEDYFDSKNPDRDICKISAKTKTLFVDIADMRISNDPSVILIARAVGPCICVSIYDPVSKVGGLLRFMLPEAGTSEAVKEVARRNPYMFADIGVPLLFQEAQKYGAELKRVTIKIAGGSQLKDPRGLLITTGERNRVAICEILREKGLVIHKADIGGDILRTISLEIATGRVCIKLPDGQEKEM